MRMHLLYEIFSKQLSSKFIMLKDKNANEVSID